MDAILKKIGAIEDELSSLRQMVKAEVQSNLDRVSCNLGVQIPLESCHNNSNEDWVQTLRSKMGRWTTRPLVVLSLFDGIGGIWASLSLLGIPFIGYSSEVNPYAVQLLKTQYPNIHHVGDVRALKKEHIKEPLDLIVGGFPCQDLSCMGKKIGLHGERSKLFFELLRVIQLFKPSWFLAENVASMHWVDRDEISKHLRCIPIEIDSQELTASKRKRLYWTNIPHPKVMPKVGDLRLTSLQHVLDNATALEQKLGCILGANPLGSHVQLQQVLENDGKQLRYINVREVERVMGFPIGYTNIPFDVNSSKPESIIIGDGARKQYVDHLRKYHEKSPEPAKKTQNAIRWQLLGNSFSVQVIAYLLSPLLDPSLWEEKAAPIVIHGRVAEHECFAMEAGEVWALYNTHQLPNWYAVIQERSGDRFCPAQKGVKKSALHIGVQFLEMSSQYVSGETDKWSPKRGAGLYQVGNVTDVQDCWLAFSHRVTGFIKIKSGYFIYPHKGEVWALYDRQKRSCPWFVLVVESKIDQTKLDSGKPGKEGFKSRCQILQLTVQIDVFRVTDKLVDYSDLLQFAFMVPYYVKNQADILKLEFSNKGRKMMSEERKRKRRTRQGQDRDSDSEDDVGDEDEIGGKSLYSQDAKIGDLACSEDVLSQF